MYYAAHKNMNLDRRTLGRTPVINAGQNVCIIVKRLRLCQRPIGWIVVIFSVSQNNPSPVCQDREQLTDVIVHATRSRNIASVSDAHTSTSRATDSGRRSVPV